MENPPPSLKNDLGFAARGFLMGAADIVPGVSGGTVALILGIYGRLLAAISRVDRQLVRLIVSGQFRAAATHLDLRFLTALGVGILAGIGGLARLMHYLMEHQLSYTFAAFFGLILGSSLLVARLCKPRSHDAKAVCILIGVVAAYFAYWVVNLDRVEAVSGHPYSFLSGSVAICAMILPGVSGSYLLLMLGKYHEITGIIKDLPSGSVDAAQLSTLAVFAFGCLVGLLLFSRVLNWLLKNYWNFTMAALCGFMVGSLYRIWPLQRDTTPDVAKFKEKVFQPYWPDTFGGEELTCLAIALGSLGFVLLIDFLSNRSNPESLAQE